MRLRLFSLILILTISCKTKTSGWQTLDFEFFKLQTPQGWTELNLKSLDSFVGGLTNGKDTLRFDYGMYSPDIGNEDPNKHLFGQDTINGLISRIVIPKIPGDGFIRMYIPVNRQDRFSISGRNIQNTDTILKIFKSIVFTESDIAINGKLTKDKFKEFPNGTGKTLFQQNCGSCHALKKIVEGPNLANLLEDRDATWLYNFLSNRKLIESDSTTKMKQENYGVLCPEFSSLTKPDIEMILSYIKLK